MCVRRGLSVEKYFVCTSDERWVRTRASTPRMLAVIYSETLRYLKNNEFIARYLFRSCSLCEEGRERSYTSSFILFLPLLIAAASVDTLYIFWIIVFHKKKSGIISLYSMLNYKSLANKQVNKRHMISK